MANERSREQMIVMILSWTTGEWIGLVGVNICTIIMKHARSKLKTVRLLVVPGALMVSLPTPHMRSTEIHRVLQRETIIPTLSKNPKTGHPDQLLYFSARIQS
jgi:hypothetical protein